MTSARGTKRTKTSSVKAKGAKGAKATRTSPTRAVIRTPAKRTAAARSTADRPESIDAYIAGFPPDIRPILERIRRTIRRAAPGAEERISYQMPAFRLERVGIVAWFGGFKEHVGLYPPVRDPVLKRASARHAGPKGNLRFRFDEPIPYGLVERIVKSRVRAKAGNSADRGSKTRKPKPTRATTKPDVSSRTRR